MTNRARTLAAYALPLVAVASSRLLASSDLRAPYLWVAALWLIVCVIEIVLARRDAGRLLWLAGATTAVVLGGYEGWLQAIEPQAGTYADSYLHSGYIRPDPVFGYGPTPGSRIVSTLRFGDELVYDVVYTIGDDGLRVTPDPGRGPDRDCVLYFGGSFTFGEGVNDDETLPARVAVETAGRLRMRNFGFHGYGPHHMLVAFESGFVERTAGCHPEAIVLQTAIWHAKRVIGATAWDDSGPRYVLDADGRPVRNGKFSDLDRPWKRHALDLLERSLVFEKKLAPLLDRKYREVGPRELDLLAAIIASARDHAAELYPDARFDVLLWDLQPENELEPLRRRFAEHGLQVHSVRSVLDRTGVDANDPDWMLDPRDPHPSPRAYAVLGQYVAREIVRP